MRILLASSEVYPFSKTGGLADMVSALGKGLARCGNQVGLVTPLYLGLRERFPGLKPLGLPLEIPLGVRVMRAEVWGLESEKGPILYFIDQPEFFQRACLYDQEGIDYPDNAERFVFFSKAVAHLAQNLPWEPQIVHSHDWQTGLVALFLHHNEKLTGRRRPRTCMTVHNLAYQGLFPASAYALTNLPWQYFTPEGLEFYGKMSCLKAGIAYADAVTTVSPRYAREILTEELGSGLDGLLRKRQPSLFGILNGVDYDEWDPTSDPFIQHHYSAQDLTAKTANKLDLQRELSLPADPAIPLFGNITRLVEQKGVDIMLGALEEMLHANIHFVLLGNGSSAFQRGYMDLARRFPARAAVKLGFDENLSHRIEAGCDFFMMPSRFEPCGLNQMYSLRYGTVPIVRATGGLDDTVIDVREDVEKANGIKFHEYSGQALAMAIRKAIALYEAPEVLHKFRMNGMAANFSWGRTATQFLDVYQKVAGQGA